MSVFRLEDYRSLMEEIYEILEVDQAPYMRQMADNYMLSTLGLLVLEAYVDHQDYIRDMNLMRAPLYVLDNGDHVGYMNYNRSLYHRKLMDHRRYQVQYIYPTAILDTLVWLDDETDAVAFLKTYRKLFFSAYQEEVDLIQGIEMQDFVDNLHRLSNRSFGESGWLQYYRLDNIERIFKGRLIESCYRILCKDVERDLNVKMVFPEESLQFLTQQPLFGIDDATLDHWISSIVDGSFEAIKEELSQLRMDVEEFLWDFLYTRICGDNLGDRRDYLDRTITFDPPMKVYLADYCSATPAYYESTIPDRDYYRILHYLLRLEYGANSYCGKIFSGVDVNGEQYAPVFS